MINLSNALGDNSDHVEALGTIREAIEILRRIAARRPESVLKELPIALNNLGIRLLEEDDFRGAVGAHTEAVAVCRRLHDRNPTAEGPILGRSLVNLAVALGTAARPHEALSAASEAVGLMDSAAQVAPDAHAMRLAEALVVRGALELELHQWGDAMLSSREALVRLVPLTKVRPSIAGRAWTLARNTYLTACSAMNVAPDSALVE